MVRLSYFFLLIIRSHALSSSLGRPLVTVSPVHERNTEDVRALGNLRYNEWMADDPNPPSIGAFCAATHEILEERNAEGALAFLARLVDDNTAVGTVELSPIELQGATNAIQAAGDFLYVTDVLTSRDHRRMGVGMALMEATERHAVELGATQLFLHVKQDNVAARKFYERRELGYSLYYAAAADAKDPVNVDRLAENAGAKGQLLLTKMLRN